MKIWYAFFLFLLASCGGSSDSPSAGGASTTDSQSPTSKFSDGPDPLAKYLWHLNNTGQANFSQAGIAGEDIRLETIHDNFRGEGTYVVVSDGRIDLNHPDLFENTVLSLSKNYVTSLNAGVDPTSTANKSGHGTNVMGLIGAIKGNGKGIFGVAPKTKLVGYNFIDSNQANSKYIDQFSGPEKAIFNYSYGYDNCRAQTISKSALSSLKVLADDVSTTKRFVYVTAAGNDYIANRSYCGNFTGSYLGNANLDQVKSYPQMIVVAALDANGKVTSYSTQGSNVWVSAPGGMPIPGLPMVSTDPVGCTDGYATQGSALGFDKGIESENSNCDYSGGVLVGTSFASPLVAGVAALVREACSSCRWREIKHILASTADKVDAGLSTASHPFGSGYNLSGHAYALGWLTNAAGFHFHNTYGFGRVNAAKAVAMAKNQPNLGTAKYSYTTNDDYYYQSGNINLAIPDKSSNGVTSTLNVDLHKLTIEHVQVRVNITHAFPSDLGLELRSPSGTISRLSYINSGYVDSNLTNVTFGSNAFYGENTFGTWTLKVVDGATTDTGTLTNWSITFLGHKPNGGPASTPATPPGVSNTGNTLQWSPSPTVDKLRYEACVVRAGDSCLDVSWITLPLGTTYTATHYSSTGWASLVSGSSYKFYIRTVDANENDSAVSELTWTAP